VPRRPGDGKVVGLFLDHLVEYPPDQFKIISFGDDTRLEHPFELVSGQAVGTPAGIRLPKLCRHASVSQVMLHTIVDSPLRLLFIPRLKSLREVAHLADVVVHVSEANEEEAEPRLNGDVVLDRDLEPFVVE